MFSSSCSYYSDHIHPQPLWSFSGNSSNGLLVSMVHPYLSTSYGMLFEMEKLFSFNFIFAQYFIWLASRTSLSLATVQR